MSIDKSLVSKGKLVRHRSVLTRTERVQHLTDEGLWDETKSVYGLPKVKNYKGEKEGKGSKRERLKKKLLLMLLLQPPQQVTKKKKRIRIRERLPDDRRSNAGV